MRKVVLIFCCSVMWFCQISFTTESNLSPPLKKVNKAINKIWKTTKFEIIKNEDINCNESGCWYKVISDKEEIGLIYNGRVNSCRSGGCSVDLSLDAISYEYFDYLLFTDNKGEVLWIKIYNYQATQGHEVMSRGWLNQFNGVNAEEELEFGRDIEAISGATVSAKAITSDIQNVLGCAF